MIYIVMFGASVLFLKISLSLKQKNFLYKLCLILSITFPCFLAGLRSKTIGTDMNVYILPLFNIAKTCDSFSEYILRANQSLKITDILYLAVNYTVSRVTASIQVELFIQELLIVIPIFSAFFIRFEKKNHIIFGVMLFYLFFYNATFNMARQSIALAFEVLSFAFLERDKKTSFYFFSFISILFHSTSALIFVPIFFYHLYQTKKISVFIKKLLLFFSITAILLFVIFIDDWLRILAGIGIISEKRINSAVYFKRNIVDFSISNILFYGFILFLIVINKKRLKNYTRNIDFYCFLALISLILLQAGAMIVFAERMTFYFLYPCVFLVVPYFSIGNWKSIKIETFFTYVFTLSVFIVYWLYWIVFLNYHETFPYKFFFYA